MPLRSGPAIRSTPLYRYSFLRQHVGEELRDRIVDVLALTSIEARLKDHFPDVHGESSYPDERAFSAWLRRGPLSLEAFFLGRDEVSPNFPDTRVYIPVPVFDFGRPKSKNWDDVSALLLDMGRTNDERGVVLRARSGSGKTVGQVKAFCDCVWGAAQGVDPTATLAGLGHVPCWLSPSRVPEGDKALVERMLLDHAGLADKLDVETLQKWLKSGQPRLLLFCDLNAVSEVKRDESDTIGDRLRLARALERFQIDHGRRGHRCVVAYRSSRKDDEVLNQLGDRFRPIDLRPLKLNDAEEYLRRFREFEARVALRVSKTVEEGGLGLPIQLPERDIDAEVEKLGEFVYRYASIPANAAEEETIDDDSAPEALISTPLLMHFVSLLTGKELDEVKTLTDLYRGVVRQHIERDVRTYSKNQDCPELRALDRAEPRLIAAMTRIALAIREKGHVETRLPHDELNDLLTHPDRKNSQEPEPVHALRAHADFWKSAKSPYHWLEPVESPETYRQSLMDFSLLRSDGKSHGFLHDSLIDFFQGISLREHEGRRRPLSASPEWAPAVVTRIQSDSRKHRRCVEFLGGAIGPDEAEALLLEFLVVKEVPSDWPDLFDRLTNGAAGCSPLAAACHLMMQRSRLAFRKFPEQIAAHAFAHLKDGAKESKRLASGIEARLIADRRSWLRLTFGRVAINHTILGRHTEAVASVAVLSDGRIVTGSWDNTVRIWDPRTGTESLLGRHDGGVGAVVELSDRRIVTGSMDKSVRIWDPTIGTETLLGRHDSWATVVAELSDGRIVTGSWDKTVRIWDPVTGTESLLGKHDDWVLAVAKLSDGRVVTGSKDTTVRVWNPMTGAETLLGIHDGPVNTVAELSDGRIATGSDDQTVRLWDPRSGEELLQLRLAAGVTVLKVLSHGRVAIGSPVGTVQIWDPHTGDKFHLGRHDSVVFAVAELSDGRLVTGSMDNTVRIWDLRADGEPLLDWHNQAVNTMAELSDGRLVTGSDGGIVQILNPRAGTESRLRGYGSSVTAVTELSDGRLVIGLMDNTLRIVNSRSGGSRTLGRQDDTVTFVAELPNGRLVTGLFNDTLWLWNPWTGTRRRFGTKDLQIYSVTALSDGRIVTGSIDNLARIWEPSTGAESILGKHEGTVSAAAELSDSRIVTGSWDYTARIWDTHTTAESLLGQHEGMVDAVAELFDGRIATGSADGTLRIWNPRTEKTREDEHSGDKLHGPVGASGWPGSGTPAPGLHAGLGTRGPEYRTPATLDQKPKHGSDFPTVPDLCFAMNFGVRSIVAFRDQPRIAAIAGNLSVMIWDVMPEALDRNRGTKKRWKRRSIFFRLAALFRRFFWSKYIHHSW